jgi:hypothetical protein
MSPMIVGILNLVNCVYGTLHFMTGCRKADFVGLLELGDTEPEQRDSIIHLLKVRQMCLIKRVAFPERPSEMKFVKSRENFQPF